MRFFSILTYAFLVGLNCYPSDSPAVYETGANSKYQGNFRSIDKVNFQEFKVLVDGKPFTLHNGSFKRFRHGQGGIEIEFINSWVVPTKPGNTQLAVIFFVQTLIGASSSRTGFVQLLAIENSKLIIKQEFRFIPLDIPHVCDFDSLNGELSIVAKSDDPSPMFAPEFADHVFYRLRGDRFEQTSCRTVSTKFPQSQAP